MHVPVIKRYYQCEKCGGDRIQENEKHLEGLVCLDCGYWEASEMFKCVEVSYVCECGSSEQAIQCFDWDSEYLELQCEKCGRYTTW